MRHQSLRRKMFTIPLVAVWLVCVVTFFLFQSTREYTAGMRAAVDAAILPPGAADSENGRALKAAQSAADEAMEQSRQTFYDDRIGLGACLFAALVILMCAAWSEAGAAAELLPTRAALGDGRLHRSPEFLELAQAAGGLGVFELDLVTGQVTGTPLFYELAGLKNSNLLFSRDEWFATIHPEDLEPLIQTLNDAIPGGGKFQFEYRSLNLSGTTRRLACTGQVLLDTEDLPARAVGTVREVPERKAILENRERYMAVSEQLPAVGEELQKAG